MKSNWFKLTIICLLGLMALSVEAAFDQRHGAKEGYGQCLYCGCR